MIPTVDDLASDPLVHRFGDHFNLPGLTNFLGCVQAEMDVMSIRALNFPPLATADTVTAGLFIDGFYFPSLGVPVSFRWWPDRIVREAEWNGWRLRSTTVLPFGRTAAVIVLEVTNLGARERDVDLRLALRGGVTRDPGPWLKSSPPWELEHDIEFEPGRGAWRFTAKRSGAVSIQGCRPPPSPAARHALAVTLRVADGATGRVEFVVALGATAAEAEQAYDSLIDRVSDEVVAVRDDWNREIEAIFTPGNDRYGGHLPLLETDDDEVRRAYLMGAVGTIYFKRDSPHSAIGRTYDTLMPRYWQSVTFLWDYSLSSTVHALLDPHVMRKNLELWMSHDVHTCFGTEWLTGGPVGGWYSVNDYAMTRMIADYVRWSGDEPWLGRAVATPSGESTTVAALVDSYATYWRQFARPGGLADYGGINNLLECVSTYVHEVASLNAANVWSMRFAAEVAERGGKAAAAGAYRDDAAALAATVNDLYVDGGGHWSARMPGGELVPVRHCYDFITVMATMPGDLTTRQTDEMAAFCERELMTPTWMRALSREDPDAVFDIRPDHQWTGAYPAWPPLAVQALYRAGKTERALDWFRGLSRSANQGPYGQAHFAEDAFEPEAGAARKSSSDFPWICDWACSSNGAWAAVVIESIFGIRAGFDAIEAAPQFGSFDAGARLRNVGWHDRLFDVDARGIRQVAG